MKTAVQEMIDIVEMDFGNGVEISMRVFHRMLLEALLKERKQIEYAFDAGKDYGAWLLDEFAETEDEPDTKEQYINSLFKSE